MQRHTLPVSEFENIPEANFSDIIKQSSLFAGTEYQNLSSAQIPNSVLQNAILKKFNSHVKKPFYVKSKGKWNGAFQSYYWLQPNELLLGLRNNLPELAPADVNHYLSRELHPFNPGETTKELEKVKLTDPFYGANGNYVLNVPVGQYALAWTKNQQPLIFAPGTHVITDDNTFKLATSGRDYKISSAFISQSQWYIKHGNLHIIRVPPGKIAKVWINNTPYFLQAREQPYFIEDPFFKIDGNNEQELFFDVQTPLLIHGTKKRVIVNEGNVAISNNGGAVEVLVPRNDKQPYYINNPNHFVVKKFLATNTCTVNFPETFTFSTSDNIDVALRLAVIYEINDPAKAAKELRKNQTVDCDIGAEILDHIKTTVKGIMTQAIKACNSQEFQKYLQKSSKGVAAKYADKLHQELRDDELDKKFSNFIQHDLEIALKEYGISFGSLRIEDSDFKNLVIKDIISKQATKSADLNTDLQLLKQKTEYETGKANLEATKANIEMKQKNDAIIANKQAELKTAQLEAEKTKTLADAKKYAIIAEAEGTKQAKILQAQGQQEANSIQTAALQDPQFYNYEMEKLRVTLLSEALPKMTNAQRLVLETMELNNDEKSKSKIIPISIFNKTLPDREQEQAKATFVSQRP